MNSNLFIICLTIIYVPHFGFTTNSCYNKSRLLVDTDNSIVVNKNYINATTIYQTMTKEELIDYNPLSEKLKLIPTIKESNSHIKFSQKIKKSEELDNTFYKLIFDLKKND